MRHKEPIFEVQTSAPPLTLQQTKSIPMETRKFEQFPLTSTQDSDQITNSSLPHELIAEILFRLPIKSLLRFKCVSKSWISLISSNQFIKAHLKFNSSQENQSVLILRYVAWNYCVNHCSLESLLNEHVTNAIDIDYPPFEAPLHFISVVGCCNGLFCIAIRVTNLFLWNPCTRKSKKLADLGIRLKENNYYIAWGFGYDEINDDYKVVAVVCILDEYGEPCGTLVKVYSTKTGSWRRIGDFQGGYPVEECGKFVNGKLHWSLDEEDCGYIGSLDLATEMYGEVDKPNFDEDSESNSDFESTLDIVQGCLCLLYDQNDDHTDVWIMKEYGVRQSWNKVFTIQINKPSRSLVFRPLYTSEKDEVLVVLGSKLVLYNPKDASYCDMVTNWDRQTIFYYDAFVYKESLVSPLLMVQQRQERHAGQGN